MPCSCCSVNPVWFASRLTTVSGLGAWWAPVTGSGGELRFNMGAKEGPLVIGVHTAQRATIVVWNVLACSLPTGLGRHHDHLRPRPQQQRAMRAVLRHHGLTPQLECYLHVPSRLGPIPAQPARLPHHRYGQPPRQRRRQRRPQVARRGGTAVRSCAGWGSSSETKQPRSWLMPMSVPPAVGTSCTLRQGDRFLTQPARADGLRSLPRRRAPTWNRSTPRSIVLGISPPRWPSTSTPSRPKLTLDSRSSTASWSRFWDGRTPNC